VELGLKTTYYLRTLGASQVEKSTLDMDEYGKTQHRGDGAAGTLTSDDGTPTGASRGSGTDGDGDGWTSSVASTIPPATPASNAREPICDELTMPILDTDTEHDPNKILPIEYDWAREYYEAGVNNNWVPAEIPMQDDVSQWNGDELTEAERRLVEWNLGFFSTAESLTANNLVLALYEYVTAPECRQYLLRQAYEEAIHTDTFIYCCDTLGFDPDYLYGMYDRVPSIQEKDEFVVDLTRSIDRPGSPSTPTPTSGRSSGIWSASTSSWREFSSTPASP